MLDKIKWLFVKGQINKINLQDDDILVIKPPTGIRWSDKKAQNMHKLIKDSLVKSGYKIKLITFVEDVNLGVIREENND
jgi:hypothetical protein